MYPIQFNTGSSLNIADVLANVGALGIFTQEMPQEEIRILVDTSIAREVILPATSSFPVQNVKFTVVDISGNASVNNITVSITGGSSDTINGAGSFIIAANFASDRFEVFNINQYFTANYLGGTSAVVGANSGVHLSGSVVQLGGSLLSNTLINGLDTTYLNLANADLSFQAAFGNLTPFGGLFTDKSLNIISNTANQDFQLAIAKDNRLTLRNVDTVSSITRSISLISTSALNATLPTGGIEIKERYSDLFGYEFTNSSRKLQLSVINGSLIPAKSVSLIKVDNTSIIAQKSIDNSNAASLISGLNIDTSPDAVMLYHHCSQSAFDGNVLKINTSGFSFLASSVVKFLIAPSGEITITLPSYADDASAGGGGLTSGMLYQTTGLGAAPLNVAGIIVAKQ